MSARLPFPEDPGLKLKELENRLNTDHTSTVERFEAQDKKIKALETTVAALQGLRIYQDVKTKLPVPGVPAAARSVPVVPEPPPPQEVPAQPPAEVPGAPPVAASAKGGFGEWKSRRWFLLYRGALSLLGILAAAAMFLVFPAEPTYRYAITAVLGVSLVNFAWAVFKKPPGMAYRKMRRRQMVSDPEADGVTTEPPTRDRALRRAMKEK